MIYNSLKNRPRIKLQNSYLDSFLDNLGWLLIIIWWVKIIFTLSKLPEVIPTHFTLDGEVDGYGSKWILLILPISGTITYIGLSILNKFPHIFNYLVEITQENAERQYSIATKMIRILKIGVVILFGLLSVMSIEGADKQTISMGYLLTPLVLLLIVFPLIYYIYKSIKEK